MNAATFHPEPVLEARRRRADRAAFSLVELLVVISIMLVLMALVGAGVSAARVSQKKQQTQSLIARLDEVIEKQFGTYAWRSVPATVVSGTTNKAAARAAYLRKLASAELPDNWKDVKAIVDGSTGIPRTPPQDAYAGVYQGVKGMNPAWPTDDYADAECLFMIVMQGGVADCLDCGGLRSSKKLDTDGDGAFEFVDAWDRPIRYVLWPAALELPPGSGLFFSTNMPFSSGTAAVAKGGTMRPLIFSGGPDGKNDMRVNADGNLNAKCGDPVGSDVGGPEGNGAADNITNFDTEASR